MLDISAFDDFEAKLHDEEDEQYIERLRLDASFDCPAQLTDLDMWKNYCDLRLYEMDKLVRQFLTKTRYRRETRGGMRTTTSLVFTAIFGRKAEPSDSQTCRYLNRLLRYYCTSYTGRTTLNGKRVDHVYKFSRWACKNRLPLSLRLRLELREGDTDVLKLQQRARNGESGGTRR